MAQTENTILSRGFEPLFFVGLNAKNGTGKQSQRKSFVTLMDAKYRIPDLNLTSSVTRSRERELLAMGPEKTRAILRREKINQRPPEEVASTAESDRHDIPAEIASQAIHIETPLGNGWVPVEASIDLENGDLSQVEEIYFVQHGVKRNAKEYFQYMKDALGPRFNPNKTLIISTQFINEIDLKGEDGLWQNRLWKGKYNGEVGIDPKDVLHYGYNDWRGAEPAQNPNTPVDSFTAMDAVIEHILDKTQQAGADVKALRFRGNSEGAQMLIRYLACSKVLKELEKEKNFVDGEMKPKMEIEGFASNPGTVLYFDRRRPVLMNRFSDFHFWKFEWVIPNEPETNLWPFGFDDPPPYIIDYLEEYSPEVASSDFMRRCLVGIGTKDNKYDGSQLPVGPGPAYNWQGFSRLERVKAYEIHLRMLDDKFVFNPKIFTATDLAHDGSAMFKHYENLIASRLAHKKYVGIFPDELTT